ncbi:MAG TPA: ABC transporter permease [Ignavibacteria bacterium]|nr:ABC transporter permease [Ignavibacteria bacterium]
MRFERFISKRYVISKNKLNFISIISILSALGITIGVAALIVVISVFNGFSSLVTSYLISFDPHVQIRIISEANLINTIKIENEIKKLDAVKGYSPFVSGKVLVFHDGLTQVVNLKGIQSSNEQNVYDIKSKIIFGEYKIGNKSSLPSAILGLPLADRLQSIVGDTISIISPSGIEKSITQYSMPKTQKFILSGIYNSKNNKYDAGYIFTNIKTAQKLLGFNNTYEGYDIKLKNISEAFNIKDFLIAKLGKKNFSINTWYDFHKDLYTVMQIEKLVAYLILSLIIAVATFNILGSLTMSVIQKKRDIGILRSMGVTRKSIKRIFMYEGLLIGIIGTAAGLLLGYFISFLQINYKIYSLDPTRYKIDALPIQLRVSDFIIITIISLLLSYFASYFPARRAAKTNPLKAIKWE